MDLERRLERRERDPQFLIREGLLEKLDDFEDDRGPVLASRLGYRINAPFVRHFVARVFDNPGEVFDEPILRPEAQDRAAFADGIRYISEAHEKTARMYFEDGSAEAVCPPVQALLTIMAYGNCDGLTAESPEFRAMFTRESVLASDWYRERLEESQEQAVRRSEKLLSHLARVRRNDQTGELAARLDLAGREARARDELERVRDPGFLRHLEGTTGAQPFK